MESGHAILRSGGFGETGLRDIYEIFAPLLDASPERPFVVAQIGQSLDGRIATVSGQSRDINGAAALDHLHRLRAHVDAVIIGAGTIAADDPQLTVRRTHGKSPARVVIDPFGQLGTKGKWLNPDGVRRIHIGTERAYVIPEAETIQFPSIGGYIAPSAIIEALFARGFRRLLIEGGPRTLSGFIEAGCVDRLHLMIAPVIIGSGKPGLQLLPEPDLKLARRPRTKAYVLESGDVLFDCDMTSCRLPSN